MLTSGSPGHLTQVVDLKQVVWDYNRVWMRWALQRLGILQELQDHVLNMLPPIKIYNLSENITAIAQLQDVIVVGTETHVLLLETPYQMRCTGPVHELQITRGIVAAKQMQDGIVAVSGSNFQSYLLSSTMLPLSLSRAHKILATRLNVAILHEPGGFFEWPGIVSRPGVLDFAVFGTGVILLQHKRLSYIPFYLDQLGWEQELKFDARKVMASQRFAATPHEVFGLSGKCCASSANKPFVFVDNYTAYWSANEGLLL
jgi:hypothetical protein